MKNMIVHSQKDILLFYQLKKGSMHSYKGSLSKIRNRLCTLLYRCVL